MQKEISEYDELHLLSADAMVGAEEEFARGNTKDAAAAAREVLALGCEGYAPAARLMLKRCGQKVKQPAKAVCAEVETSGKE